MPGKIVLALTEDQAQHLRAHAAKRRPNGFSFNYRTDATLRDKGLLRQDNNYNFHLSPAGRALALALKLLPKATT